MTNPSPKPAGVQNSVFDVARAARGGVRKKLPALDIGKLVFKTGVPKPPRTKFNRLGTKYAVIFDRLKVGSSVELPAAYKHTLSRWPENSISAARAATPCSAPARRPSPYGETHD